MKLSVYNSASLSGAVAVLVALFSAVSTSVIVRGYSAIDPQSDGSFEPHQSAGLTFCDSEVK
jgi:hypothetical protein